jgi:hypothetical protein
MSESSPSSFSVPAKPINRFIDGGGSSIFEVNLSDKGGLASNRLMVVDDFVKMFWSPLFMTAFENILVTGEGHSALTEFFSQSVFPPNRAV